VEASEVSAIVLAAGRGSRMGGGKMLRTFEGRPLVMHALEPLLALGLGEIVVVTGFDADAVEAVLPSGVEAVRCMAFESGMGVSLATGVRACRPDATAFLVVLGDMPRVPCSHYCALLSEGSEIVATRSVDYAGPPTLIPARLRSDLEALEGDRGAKSLFGDGVRFVSADPDWVQDFNHAIESP